MILVQEQEFERLDAWERVLKTENKELDPWIARRRLVCRRTMETLELVMKHEQEFVKMVKARQEAAARLAARVESIEKLSEAFTPKKLTAVASGAR